MCIYCSIIILFFYLYQRSRLALSYPVACHFSIDRSLNLYCVYHVLLSFVYFVNQIYHYYYRSYTSLISTFTQLTSLYNHSSTNDDIWVQYRNQNQYNNICSYLAYHRFNTLFGNIQLLFLMSYSFTLAMSSVTLRKHLASVINWSAARTKRNLLI